MYAESLLAYQESVLLRRVLAATDSVQKIALMAALHDITNAFNALGKYVEANAAVVEALEMNHRRVVEGCLYTPDFDGTTGAPQNGFQQSPTMLITWEPVPSRPTQSYNRERGNTT